MRTTEKGGPRGGACPRAGRGPDPGDAAKKVEGRERHIAADSSSGFLLGILVHAADIQDADAAGELLRRIERLHCRLRAVFADGVHDRLPVLLACFLLGLTLIVARRVAGVTGLVLVPWRRVAERTLGRLGQRRRLARDCEELPEVSEAAAKLAMIRLMPQRLAHPRRRQLPLR